jgi:hypothetical protein
MKFNWQHACILAATVGTAVFEALANFAAEGGKLPYHLTASACLLVVTVMGAVSKSVLPKESK